MRQFPVLGTLIFLVLVLAINKVHSYGYVGHQITGAIAQRFLTPRARRAVLELLPPEAHGNLSAISHWADTVRRTPGYGFSTRLHYWNPVGDNPPEKCTSVWIEGRYDVISAVLNYTHRLDPKTGLEHGQRVEALKFLVHFIGDLHQPLHLSGKWSGGNGARAIFDHRKTNLHAIWDSLLLCKQICKQILGPDPDFENYVKHESGSNVPHPKCPLCAPNDDYISSIITLLTTIWRREKYEWIKCVTKKGQPRVYNYEFEEFIWTNSTRHKKPINRKPRPSMPPKVPPGVCPLFWALQVHDLNCNMTWYGYDPEIDLGQGEYYDRIIETKMVEKLLAIAGVRVAAVLNRILG